MHSHLIWTFHSVLHHPEINQCLLILMCSYTDPFGQLTHRHLVSVLRHLLVTLRDYFYPVEPSGSFPRRRNTLSLNLGYRRPSGASHGSKGSNSPDVTRWCATVHAGLRVSCCSDHLFCLVHTNRLSEVSALGAELQRTTQPQAFV